MQQLLQPRTSFRKISEGAERLASGLAGAAPCRCLNKNHLAAVQCPNVHTILVMSQQLRGQKGTSILPPVHPARRAAPPADLA